MQRPPMVRRRCCLPLALDIIEVVELLLQNNADPNLANERGATAIDWALKTENTDIADLLRKAGGPRRRSGGCRALKVRTVERK
jgi:hypothetical protein